MMPTSTLLLRSDLKRDPVTTNLVWIDDSYIGGCHPAYNALPSGLCVPIPVTAVKPSMQIGSQFGARFVAKKVCLAVPGQENSLQQRE